MTSLEGPRTPRTPAGPSDAADEIRRTARAIGGAVEALATMRPLLTEEEVDRVVAQLGRRAAELAGLADRLDGVEHPADEVGETGAEGHAVRFYAEDGDLVDQLAGFVVEGLARGEAVVVVATQGHRSALAGSLPLGVEDEVRWLDAATTLAALSVDGAPHPEGFRRTIGPVVRQATVGHVGVRIYGEMVALLWEGGDVIGALRLEGMWNELRAELAFELLCGYQTADPSGDLSALGFAEVCAAHRHVLRPT